MLVLKLELNRQEMTSGGYNWTTTLRSSKVRTKMAPHRLSTCGNLAARNSNQVPKLALHLIAAVALKHYRFTLTDGM